MVVSVVPYAVHEPQSDRRRARPSGKRAASTASLPTITRRSVDGTGALSIPIDPVVPEPRRQIGDGHAGLVMKLTSSRHEGTTDPGRNTTVPPATSVGHDLFETDSKLSGANCNTRSASVRPKRSMAARA